MKTGYLSHHTKLFFVRTKYKLVTTDNIQLATGHFSSKFLKWPVKNLHQLRLNSMDDHDQPNLYLTILP